MTIKIWDMEFRTKAEATAYFSKILNSYGAGQELCWEDEEMVKGLLERHPEAAEKIGVGIASIFVERTPYGSKGFRLRRIDGSETDFSYRCCIRGEKPSARIVVMTALRQVVAADIQRVKWSKYIHQMRCPLSGELLTRDNAHVDHEPPLTFEVICETFAAQSAYRTLDRFPITNGRDNQYVTEITDAALAIAFRDYHAKVANLRLISKMANLKIAPLHRIRKSEEGRLKIS